VTHFSERFLGLYQNPIPHTQQQHRTRLPRKIYKNTWYRCFNLALVRLLTIRPIYTLYIIILVSGTSTGIDISEVHI
jgi:hypothetical protein